MKIGHIKLGLLADFLEKVYSICPKLKRCGLSALTSLDNSDMVNVNCGRNSSSVVLCMPHNTNYVVMAEKSLKLLMIYPLILRWKAANGKDR